MNTTDRALEVPCPLCKVPAGVECVNVIDGSGPRDQPHYRRAVRARTVRPPEQKGEGDHG